MSADSPNRAASDVLRIENRSDRVWLFGYLRLVPFAMLVVGVVAVLVLREAGVRTPATPSAGIATLVFIVLLIVLDRSPLLDPVDFVEFSGRLRVKRLAGDRTWDLARLRAVELAPVEGEDFDDARQVVRHWRVTLRLRWAWPSPRLLVSDTRARAVVDWAEARSIPVLGRPAT